MIQRPELVFSLTWSGLKINRTGANVFIGRNNDNMINVTQKNIGGEDKTVFRIDNNGEAEFGGSIIVRDGSGNISL